MERDFFVVGVLDPSDAEVEAFASRAPFPSQRWDAFVAAPFFGRLVDEFPPRDRFERHERRPREWQRPHDRYYLGDVRAGLSDAWRAAVDAFSSTLYRRFLARMLGAEPRHIRFAWHRSVRGDEVSPHNDAEEKLGTHIFYCHAAGAWDRAWGGDTLLLGGRREDAAHPDFVDFVERTAVGALDSQCLLFRRTDASWHGVEPLTCPDGCDRQTFHVIAER